MIRAADGEHRDDRQRCANRLPGGIFVGEWISEIGEYAIAHEFGDEAIESGDHTGARVMPVWMTPRGLLAVM